MSEQREAMDPFFAVFNGHINNAHQRAHRAFNRKFGPGAWRKHMAHHNRNGIMSIFNQPSNKHTRFYVETVHRIVNENVTA